MYIEIGMVLMVCGVSCLRKVLICDSTESWQIHSAAPPGDLGAGTHKPNESYTLRGTQIHNDAETQTEIQKHSESNIHRVRGTGRDGNTQ